MVQKFKYWEVVTIKWITFRRVTLDAFQHIKLLDLGSSLLRGVNDFPINKQLL